MWAKLLNAAHILWFYQFSISFPYHLLISLTLLKTYYLGQTMSKWLWKCIPSSLGWALVLGTPRQRLIQGLRNPEMFRKYQMLQHLGLFSTFLAISNIHSLVAASIIMSLGGRSQRVNSWKWMKFLRNFISFHFTVAHFLFLCPKDEPQSSEKNSFSFIFYHIGSGSTHSWANDRK